jgi:hypothetical protein
MLYMARLGQEYELANPWMVLFAILTGLLETDSNKCSTMATMLGLADSRKPTVNKAKPVKH